MSEKGTKMDQQNTGDSCHEHEEAIAMLVEALTAAFHHGEYPAEIKILIQNALIEVGVRV